MTYFVQTIIDAVSLGSLYALVALAIGLVFGIMRLINFVQADYITVGAYALIIPSTAVAPTLFIGAWPLPAAVLTIIAITIALALITERVVFRPLRTADPTILLIASFSLSYLLQHAVLLIYSGKPKPIGFAAYLSESITFLGLRVPQIQLVTMGVCLLLLVALTLFLRNTRIGIQMRASAEDFGMARVLGVRANSVIALAFAISGLLGGVVALLFVIQIGSIDFRMGVLPVIFAFFAAVIGGLGSLVGAALGGFILGFGSQMLQAYLPGDMRPLRDAFLFGGVILILLVRPQGLVHSRSSRERV